MKAVTKFVANDGTEFTTEIECIVHDAKLEAKSKVDSYLDAAGLKGAQRTLAANAILGYLGHISAFEPVNGAADVSIAGGVVLAGATSGEQLVATQIEAAAKATDGAPAAAEATAPKEKPASKKEKVSA